MATVYDIRDYGAIGDGKYNNANAIQKAIDLCHQNGGFVILKSYYLQKSGNGAGRLENGLLLANMEELILIAVNR